jgi:hypothetical protein
MDMNWSPVVILRKIPVPTVDEISPTRLRMNRMTTPVMLSIIPLATIEAPKHMAQSISQIVYSMPAMPRVDTSSLSEVLPVSTAVEP